MPSYLRHLLVPALLLAAPTVLPADGPASVQVLIELADPPAARVWSRELPRSRGAAVTASRAQLRRIETAQASLLEALATPAIDAEPLFRVQRVLNAVAVRVDADRLAAIERLPGVVAVRRIVPKAPANSTSVPFLGTPAVWDPGGFDATGDGVTIGVIDSGLDYLHTHFGGSGLAADYAANDTTVIGDGFFPTVKVAGGWDFVGDAYDASSADPGATVPMPDPDPMDCDGHGTHVAGTAAGFGVAGDGTTYAGVYSEATPFASLAIGPGVAPEATLYGLRVFGCNGTTAVVEAALEWAVDPDGDGDFSDHLDVVNLSLASPFGSAGDPTAAAADNAALAGVIVVAAAGNDFDTFFVVGSPAAADRAIAVAATWDDDPSFPARGVRVTSPPQVAGTHQAGGANFGAVVTLPGTAGQAAATDPADACTALANPGEVAGKIAVVDRGDACTFPTAARHAQDAGALGVVFVNHRPGLEGVFDDGTGGDITLPVLMIRRDAGAALQAQLPGVVELTMTPVMLADIPSLSSSRGPRRASPEGDPAALALKPDVAAPGVAITSSDVGDAITGGTGARILSGTSMATPHVAGAAALLRQLSPDLSVAEIKTLLATTGRPVTFDPEQTPPRVGPSRVGGGRLAPAGAAAAEAFAYAADTPERVGVAFGALEVRDETVAERLVRVENRTASPLSYDLEVETLADVPGVEVTLPDGAALEVPAGGSADFRLRLTATAAAMRHTHDPALEEGFLGLARHWLSEEAGAVRLTPGAGETLRVPFHAAARPVSAMAAAAGVLDLGPGLAGSTSLALAGSGLDTGLEPPVDELSLVSAFELQALADTAGADPLALTHVGVATDVPAAGLEDGHLFFGLATRDGWSTPQGVLFEIFLDLDRDGESDFVLANADRGKVDFGLFLDAFWSVLRNLETDTRTFQQPVNLLPPGERHTVAFRNNVLALAVSTADLGLAPGPFEYFVRVSRVSGGGSLAGRKSPLTPLFQRGEPEASASWAGRGVPEAFGVPRADRRLTSPRAFSTVGEPPATRASFGGPPAGSANADTRQVVDESTVLTFEPTTPGLDVASGGPPIYPDLDGASIPITYDLAAFDTHGSLGLLLLHHHGARGQRAEVVTLAAELPDLAVALAAPNPVAPGSTLTYLATAANDGAVPAAGVTLEHTLPAGISFEPMLSDPSCTAMGSAVTCTLGTVDPATGTEIEIAGTVDPGVPPGTLLLSHLRATTTEIDPNPLNDEASTATLVSNVLPRATKEVGGELTEGGSVTYRVHVRNAGTAPLDDNPGPEIADPLPAEIDLVSASATSGSVAVDGDVVTWNGSLAPGGGEVTLEIAATVRAGTGGRTVSNQAAVHFDADGDGSSESSVPSDDPTLPGLADATVFRVRGLFEDGFESGDTSAWSGAS